jgi:hypothetical protein
MSHAPNPYSSPSGPAETPLPQGNPAATREAAARGAGRLQLLGILSIVFGICCPLIGIGLGAVTLAISGRPTAAAQQLAASELLDKVATGKTCAIVGLVIGVLNSLVGAVTAVVNAFQG